MYALVVVRARVQTAVSRARRHIAAVSRLEGGQRELVEQLIVVGGVDGDVVGLSMQQHIQLVVY